MKKSLLISMFLAGSVFAAQVDRKPDVVVERRYEAPEGGVLQGAGACSISIDDVACWDMDGNPDARLTETVRAQFLVRETTFQVAFRKKNRLLVVYKRGSINAQLASGQRSNNFYQSFGGNDGTQMIGIATDADLKTASVLADFYQIGQPKKSRIELKKGMKSTSDGMTVEFVDATKLPAAPGMARNVYPPIGNGPAWRIRAVVTGYDALRMSQASPLGRDGNPIRYVDSKGKPVSVAEYLRANPNRTPYPNPNFGDANAKYQQAQINGEYGYDGGAFSWVTNVDPQYMAAIETSRYDRRLVEITGFPLDPKG